jgi:hypothetical protein
MCRCGLNPKKSLNVCMEEIAAGVIFSLLTAFFIDPLFMKFLN